MVCSVDQIALSVLAVKLSRDFEKTVRFRQSNWLVIAEKTVCVALDENAYLTMIRVVNCGNIISNIWRAYLNLQFDAEY